jgi:molybdenum cofactor cytidylyltransferase
MSYLGLRAVPVTLVRMTVAAIILAAGASRRLGQPKQLLRYGGETLLGRAIRLADEAGATPVLAILGAQAEAVGDAVDPRKAVSVLNPDWEQGIASSIHAGLHAVDAASAGVLILSCDQPRLTANHLRGLIDAFIDQPARTIVASEYAGVHGVPAIFPRAVFPNLFALEGDKGARTLLIQPPCLVVGVPFPGGEIDVDKPDDLEHLS